jgi:hypothetical protein
MFNKRKRGLSEIVAYVLLISISLAIAGSVFSWLKFYTSPSNEINCEEGVSLTIRNYVYNCSSQGLNLTIQNNGLFDIDGYIIRVNNISSTSKIGILTLNRTGAPIQTEESHLDSYLEINRTIKGTIYFVEVQPILNQSNSIVYCKDKISRQSLSCSQ